jgi:type II secretory pathway pseudopilin PulG
MKLKQSRVERRESMAKSGLRLSTLDLRPTSAFTMVEIAISLAVIGIALVGILGVLPLGMKVQRDNREQTVLNQDATEFIEAIRNGARGGVDLTNYVFAITNYWRKYTAGVAAPPTQPNGYDYANTPYVAGGYYTSVGHNLTNDAAIIGLLSTPEFTDANGDPIYLSTDTNGVWQFPAGDVYSNHVIAYVRSLSGPAVEKPPQDNLLLRGSSFSYKLFVVNASLPNVTNLASSGTIYDPNLMANLHELRLTFLWPLQPNNAVGPNLPITFRTSIAGRLARDTNLVLCFYQSQYFDTNNILGP